MQELYHQPYELSYNPYRPLSGPRLKGVLSPPPPPPPQAPEAKAKPGQGPLTPKPAPPVNPQHQNF